MAHRQRVSVSADPAADRADKTCASCGRRIEWRAKWAKNWDAVKYCSDACRAHRVDDTDLQLEETITTLLAARAQDATICPSDAARAIGGDEWRDLMEPARRAARRMVARGDLQITQGGHVVDPSTAKGPIRLRRPRLNPAPTIALGASAEPIARSYNFAMSSSRDILDARARAGLTQSQLARRADVPQHNLSAYEAGRVQPRPETLDRILAATAERPSVVLRRERHRVIELALHRKAGTVRVFGSIARGTDSVGSDVDLLVTFAPDASILDAAGLVLDLENLLGVHVDVMSDRAEGTIRNRAEAEAVPL